jgi:preprotein translocase subunit SecA
VITPTQEYRRTGFNAPPKLFKGVDARVHALAGVYQRRSGLLRDLHCEAEKIDALAPAVCELTDHKLRLKLMEYREIFRRGGKQVEACVGPALAAIREVSDRQLSLRPFLVQIMGALALHRGCLAEMATGEGKTLTAGLAAVLAGWTKRPCHVVTVNDYLVQRDPEWLKALYAFCGVKVGCVVAKMSPAERREGYACDVTYATSKELLADFLRDRLQIGTLQNPARRLLRQMLRPQNPDLSGDGLVMRGLHAAIIDEADSVLIDEAVTPLIISTLQKNDLLREVVQMAQAIVADLERGADYEVNERYREVELTKAGLKKLQTGCANLPGIWQGPERRLELIRQALTAREFYQQGKQYVVVEDKVVIVDEFTGRPMPQRSWRQGMHQAIEAKESLPITDPAETIARMSFQRFFRLFSRLSGMTGTAQEAAGEFWQIYKLPVIRIPTNRPCIRAHWPDRVFSDSDTKWRAIVDEIERLHATGRPLLIGTRSVAASEHLAGMLAQRHLNFKLLNAVRHQEEAQIVAEAGVRGRITIATNMAGRGTDIKLGKDVSLLGGLHVIATERHESGRVDRQLFGRAARQGDPGSAQAFVSADDELLRRYLPKTVSNNLRPMLERNVFGRHPFAEAAFALAQRKAQRLAFRQRRNVLMTDDWMEDALSFAGPSEA